MLAVQDHAIVQALIPIAAYGSEYTVGVHVHGITMVHYVKYNS